MLPSRLQDDAAEQYMTASSAPCLRAARKTQVRGRKKTSERKKNTFGSRKKMPCSGKKLFLQRGKTPATNAFAAGKIQSSRKNTLQQQKKHLYSRKKCILEAAEKLSEVGKNCPRQKKPGRGRKKLAAEKAQLCNPKVAATCNGKNSFPQREKAAAPIY